MDEKDKPKVGRPSNKELLAKAHAQSLADFDRAWSAQRDVREACRQERRFVSVPGAQWEGPLGEQFERRPKFEVNKCRRAVIRVYSEYRANRIDATFQPRDGARGPAVDKLADTCAGVHRADESDSGADEAYDNGFDEAVSGGMGAWRLCARYEDEYDDENDRQRIAIEPIVDADQCVYFDIDAKRQDKRDATQCWVLTEYSHEAFRDEFGHDPTSWPANVQARQGFDWYKPKTVYVAEHYKVETVKVRVQVWRGLDGRKIKAEFREARNDEEEDAWINCETGEVVDPAALKVQGFKRLSEKKVDRKRVRKYIESGLQVEEDCGYIAGTEIPIVPVYGLRWYVDGIERFQGLSRVAMDAQRLANMVRSKLGEIAAKASVKKPIFTPDQMKGHQHLWETDSVKNYSYLLINPIYDAAGQMAASGPVGYLEPPDIPPALAALAQVIEQDLKDLLGEQQAEEIRANVSGDAVDMVQQRLDMLTFIYVSNFAKAKRRSAEVWLGMARELYAERGRRLKVVTSQGEVSAAEVQSKELLDPSTHETYLENDLSRAYFDVQVDVGPSSSSLRRSLVRAATTLRPMTQDPTMGAVLEYLTLSNIEGEGLAEVREWSRKTLVRMGVLRPTDEEAQQMAEEAANAQPDAQQQYLLAEADKAKAVAGKTRADTALSMAKTELTQAQAAETLADIGRAGGEQVTGDGL